MTLATNKFAGCTLTQVANGYLVAKTRKEALAYLAAKASVTKRKRWINAAKAAAAGDDLRMAAYAAEGREATNAAWAAVPREPKADVTPIKPKARTKKPTKEQRLIAEVELEVGRADRLAREAKAKANPSAMDALTEQVLALDEAAFAAFTRGLANAKRK